MEKIMNTQGTSRHSVTVGLPKFVVVSRLGNVSPQQFTTAQAAADFAKECFPDQQQDPDRTGAGWDVEIVR